MSDMEELMSRLEAETGEYWTTPEESPALVAGLVGAMARQMGHSHFPPRDDVAVGYYILNCKPETKIDPLLLGFMLYLGPDEAARLFGS